MKQNHRVLSVLLTLCMVIATFAAGTTAAFAQGGDLVGDGSTEAPYQIQDAEDLMAFIALAAEDPDACAVLKDNIDLQGIALTAAPISTYEGTFDGGGFTVSGLEISGSGGNKAIFRTISEGGVVKDLNVSGSVSGTSNTAGIAATSYGSIENCSFTGTVTGTYPVGGIVAQNSGQVTGCTNRAAVTGSFHVGGIAGRNGNTSVQGSIEDCTNYGVITGTDTNSGSGGTGGITGTNFDTVDGCENFKSVTGGRFAGGIVGYTTKPSGWDAVVINSRNAGDVKGLHYVGGIAGYQFGAQIASCYNEGSISAAEGARTSAGFGGIAGCIEAVSSNPTTVSNCYNTGAVTASGTSQRAGGIVGVNNSSGAVVEYCYNIGTVGNSAAAANAGSIAGSSRGTVKSCITITDALPAVGSGNGTSTDLEQVEEAALSNADTFASWTDFDTYWTIDPMLGRPVLNNASESGGQGTEEIPYEIPDLDTLILIRDRAAEGVDFSGYYFTLSADINLNGSADNPWQPIGIDNVYPFNGIFDGNGHTVSGLYIDSNDDYQGLFGYIGNSGAVKNLTVSGEVKTTSQSAGGIAGRNGGEIVNCNSAVNVTGSMQIGGIAGRNAGTIEKCSYAAGTVTGERYQGGIAGYNEGTITDSYSRGEVDGGEWTGGISGTNANLIKNCYSVGELITEIPTTGVTTGTVLNSYYLAGQEEITSTGTGKTAEQFASGEITWLLNEGKADGTQTFYQTCGEGYPEYARDTVYQITNYHCPGDTVGVTAYSNVNEGTTGEHRFTEEIETDKYLHTAGTCINEAVYCKSCEYCGEASPTETFTGEKDPDNHAHLIKVDAKPATYEETGNIEYWYCGDCGGYFGDEAGTKEISAEKTIIEKLKKSTDDTNGSSSPQTGDYSSVTLWTVLLLLSAGGLTGVIVHSRKRKMS